MPDQAHLPSPELDTKAEFASRAHISLRTVNRQIELGLPVIRIGGAVRIDPQRGMAFLRGERSPPEPVRRGRPRKRAVS
jgi:hypothetical protein